MGWTLEHDADGVVVVAGELSGDEVGFLRQALEARLDQADERVLDLTDLDPLDGIAVVELVNAIRTILADGGTLEIEGAPQMLAHTLYKIGGLRSGRLRLSHPRQDEGTTAN